MPSGRPIPSGRVELHRRIVQRFHTDAAFRDLMRADPDAALVDELGAELPDGLEVVVVEERPDRLCIVIPLDCGLDEVAVAAVTGQPAARPSPVGGET